MLQIKKKQRSLSLSLFSLARSLDEKQQHKKNLYFNYDGLIELAKKYKTIYIESERIDPNTIIFEKVEYEYYIDDM